MVALNFSEAMQHNFVLKIKTTLNRTKTILTIRESYSPQASYHNHH